MYTQVQCRGEKVQVSEGYHGDRETEGGGIGTTEELTTQVNKEWGMDYSSSPSPQWYRVVWGVISRQNYP